MLVIREFVFVRRLFPKDLCSVVDIIFLSLTWNRSSLLSAASPVKGSASKSAFCRSSRGSKIIARFIARIIVKSVTIIATFSSCWNY